jgi:hypothetical protein
VSVFSAAACALALVLGSIAGPASADGLGGIISEVRGGILVHDVGRDNPTKTIEENTIDINGEILSVPLVVSTSSIPFVQSMLAPRANLGFSANTSGWTNNGYGGLSWEWGLGAGFFFDFAFGMDLHDGQLKATKTSTGAFEIDGRPNLGSSVLFREAVDIGYRIDNVNSLSAYAAHISNAGWIAPQNDGMNFLGVRYGFRFN